MLITHSCLVLAVFWVVHVAHHKQVAHYLIDLNNGLVVNRSGTKRSFCQLLYTIENHCHSIESNGCLSIVHSKVPKILPTSRSNINLISKICQKMGESSSEIQSENSEGPKCQFWSTHVSDFWAFFVKTHCALHRPFLVARRSRIWIHYCWGNH